MTSPQPPYPELSRNILDFCSLLRVQEFKVGPQEVQDALRAAALVDIGEYAQFRDTLALVFCSTHEQEDIFDVLFRAFFLPAPPKAAPPESQAKASEGEGEGEEQAPQQRNKQSASPKTEVGVGSSLGGAQDSSDDNDNPIGTEVPTLQVAFSPFARRDSVPAEVPLENMDAMLDAAGTLVRRLRLGRSRRWRSAPRGARIHFRRTLRGALQTGGEVVRPAFLAHPRRKPRFVLLLDGSRSMAAYSDKLLQFAHALTQRSSRVEVYLFSTELKRVTRHLKKAKPGTPTRLNDLGEAWGGGTRIGACLSEFVRHYGAGTLTRDTLVMIASDGLDTDKPELLKRAMRDIHRRSAGVVWLNPLLDTAGYQPTAAGMQAALPYIDTFTTANDVASFGRLSRRIHLR